MSKHKFPDILKKEEVKLVILDGANKNADLTKYYDLAYQHWSSIWEEHFKERDGIKKLYSDNFTRQDEICTFFWQDICIGALCSRVADLSHQAFLDDSYFELWDKETIRKLTRDGSFVAICSQLSVEPGCPLFEEGVKARDVILHLVISHLRRCGFNAITGVARKDKGMHQSLRLLAAETLKEDLKMHNGFVDVMAFYQDGKIVQDSKVIEVSDYIWNERVGEILIPEQRRLKVA